MVQYSQVSVTCLFFLFGKVTFGTPCTISILKYRRYLLVMQSGVLMKQKVQLIFVYSFVGFETLWCHSRECNGSDIKDVSEKQNVRD